jgi:probable F420-dependent oxidoreductase
VLGVNVLAPGPAAGKYRRVVELTVSVQAEPRGPAGWLALARRLEARGHHALLIGDHPGNGASPWPALGAAAAVTTTLRLGTYVLQAGVREPVHMAADAATLDLLAPGRVLLGLGAGHTPQEWLDIGRTRPAPRDRARRLVESVDAVARLLRGETVSVAGEQLTLDGARLTGLPVGAGRVGLVVGGGHPDVLRVAAARADVVGLSGLGRTLADGHRHEVRWSERELEAALRTVRDEARRVGTSPAVEVLVQHVIATDDRAAAIEELRARVPGTPVEDLATTPFLLIGTPEEMAAQLRRQADRYGITRYVVREPATEPLEQALALLAG